MNPQQFNTLATLCVTVALAGWVTAGLAGFGSSGIGNTQAPIADSQATSAGADAGPVDAQQATAMGSASVSGLPMFEAALPDPGQKLAPETPQVAAASTFDSVQSDLKEAVSAETMHVPQAAATGQDGGQDGVSVPAAPVIVAAVMPDARPGLPPEAPAEQVAAATTADLTADPVHNDAKEAVGAEPAVAPQAAATGEDGASVPSVAIVVAALPDPGQKLAPEAPPAQVAIASTADPAHDDAREAVCAEPSATPQAAATGEDAASVPSVAIVVAALSGAGPELPRETPPAQIAAASTADPVHSDAKEAVGAEPAAAPQAAVTGEQGASVPDAAIVVAALPDAGAALPPETPSAQAPDVSPAEPVQNDAKQEVSSLDLFDECLVPDICIDHFLWGVYERTFKVDTIKVSERTRVVVTKKGKTRTVTRTVTKLVDEDFGWKDPIAAERTGKSLKDYVIGGMNRGFKLKLYHALHALEDAGLAPGMTSGFRDDYRQSIATGKKAASDSSYHGGSRRGGYGHGLAADLVSVKGETRAQRWISSENLWKWIDAHGKEFGVGRPYLDRDPPHVGPIDGQEYAKHHGGAKTRLAGSETKKRHRLGARDDHSKTNPATTASSGTTNPATTISSGTTKPATTVSSRKTKRATTASSGTTNPATTVSSGTTNPATTVSSRKTKRATTASSGTTNPATTISSGTTKPATTTSSGRTKRATTASSGTTNPATTVSSGTTKPATTVSSRKTKRATTASSGTTNPATTILSGTTKPATTVSSGKTKRATTSSSGKTKPATTTPSRVTSL
jgi:hypothetical protein